MMRIRHLVCTDNFAGVERYAATTSTELARRGHDLEVFGGRREAMTAALGGSSVSFVDAPGPGAALRASLHGAKPDIVHAHMTGADLVAVATRPLCRAPVISTLHFAQARGHDGLTRTLYSVIPRLVTTEVAISQFVADSVSGDPTVIPNGVPVPAGTSERQVRAPIVLAAQRLESEKSTAVALQAFAASGLTHRGWELHVAGEGSERARLERQAIDLGIDASTRFLGRVDDLGRRMGQVSLLLATARAEPFGLSVVEAMAAGLPVIAADGGAHSETIGSATPETLFPPGDADAAAALLRRFAADPTAREELGARGRQRHAEAFTIEAHVDELEELYDQVIAARRDGRPPPTASGRLSPSDA
ncbi:MAG TPA: glycosyltransferase family 4 protein [Acidimicrobiales bacterium]|nr:glycosyltransferase family 4 protein [Acidimicrobiales bacterium]